MRREALAKPEVGDFLNKNCVSTFTKVGTFSVTFSADGLNERKNGGNVAAFLCAPNGRVIHAIAGPRNGDAFLTELKWATRVYAQILADPKAGMSQVQKAGGSRIAAALREVHGNAHETLTGRRAPDNEWVATAGNSGDSRNDGRQRRQQVHRLLQRKAFEPLTSLGPEVYGHILGEHVTMEPVRLAGHTEGQKAAGAPTTLSEFFKEGGGDARPKPAVLPPTPSKAEQAKAKSKR